jgi:hypothetical protein
MPKVRRTIAEKDVDRIFDIACIKQLATLAGLKENPDTEQQLGKLVREDVRIFCRDVLESTNNDLHREMKRLHDVCEKRAFEQAGAVFACISSRTRSELVERWERTNRGTRFPAPEDFTMAEHREAACSAIASVCRIGGSYIDGRLRPSGKRSRTWQWLYYAPEPKRHFQKTSAELRLVMHLALTWLIVTGKSPPKVVNRDKPGPFARTVRKCFHLSGTAADSINVINEFGRRREE